jgi:hypothetical protein
MSFERAERLLAKAKRWHSGKTDLEIARTMDEASGLGIFMFFCIGISFLRNVTANSSASPHQLWLLVPIVGFMIYMGIMKRRYASVRRLFEDRAPQNLGDLIGAPNTH